MCYFCELREDIAKRGADAVVFLEDGMGNGFAHIDLEQDVIRFEASKYSQVDGEYKRASGRVAIVYCPICGRSLKDVPSTKGDLLYLRGDLRSDDVTVYNDKEIAVRDIEEDAMCNFFRSEELTTVKVLKRETCKMVPHWEE